MLDMQIKAQLGAMALDVDINAGPGVTVLFGPSGAGKTSVINAVAGLLRPDAGRIAIGDQVVFDGKTCLPPHKRNVGYVFQDARLFPHMTVAQNLRYGGDHNADKTIAVLGLEGVLERRPAGLSGGEAQRVALGRALMRNPDVLLLDEPLAALDGPRKAEVMPYLASLHATAKVPIIYVTHAMREVTQLADQLVILDAGRVMRQGTVTDVLADPACARYFEARDAGAVLGGTVARVDAADGVTEVVTPAGIIRLAGALGAIGQAVRVRIPAHDIILARQEPVDQSALNALPVQITAIDDLATGGVAVRVTSGEGVFWAAITPRSARLLGLAVGQDIYAVFKAQAMGAG